LTEFFDHRIGVYYSRVERVHDLDSVAHPSVRECLRFLGINGGVEIHIASDLPARTGLGSSSSFTVGLLRALHAFKGEMAGAAQLADEAVRVEQEMIRERVGCQDQYTCAFGGLLNLVFGPDGVSVHPVTIDACRQKALEDRLMLFYTGVQRTAHEVIEEQLRRTEQGDLLAELDGLRSLVAEGVRVLTGAGDLGEFGELLHKGWILKRRCSSRVSLPWVDELYGQARSAGATGGKLLGAGSGGFLLLFAEPGRHAAVRTALGSLREVNFRFEHGGSEVVFYQP
jgi:D-glycero-alpha-D-manno-heptose-7-phosphate kinase